MATQRSPVLSSPDSGNFSATKMHFGTFTSIALALNFVPPPAIAVEQAILASVAEQRSTHVSAENEFTWRYTFFHEVEAEPIFASIHDVSTALKSSPILAQLPIVTKYKTIPAKDIDIASERDTLALVPLGPDVSDRATVINLAKMTSDAYVLDPSQPDWLNTSLKFNYSSSFGWEGDGLRGHVFADTWNKTVIVAFKGTTVFPGSKWGSKDRLNDNLLFSCCCGAQRPDPYPYQPSCDCPSAPYQCNSTCLTQEIGQKDRYYAIALDVMFNVTQRFPESQFWVVGHSLGGAIASLMGHTLNFPVVTFESPPERLPAHRLGLVKADGPPTYHIGNTADPIFMGACNGWSSSCGIAGYSFESQCFTGKRCAYDTVEDLGWRLSIANHRISVVISDVLEKYNTTPACVSDTDSGCVDCYNWNFSTSAPR